MTNTGGPNRHESKTERIRKWMDLNPGWPQMTSGEIQRLLALHGIKVSHGLVQRAKRLAGVAPRPWVPSKPRKAAKLRTDIAAEAPEPIADAAEPEVAKVIADAVMTTEQKREMLTRIANDPDVRSEGRISAINALHKIDESIGKTKELGPGPPLTLEARTERLALLIAACGPDVHRAALARARKEWNATVPEAGAAPQSS